MIASLLGKYVAIVLVFLSRKCVVVELTRSIVARRCATKSATSLILRPSTTQRRVLGAGDEIDGVDFGIAVDALGYVVEADAARGVTLTSMNAKTFSSPNFSQSITVL